MQIIKFYKIFSIFLIPFIKINLKIRILKGKESKLRYKERYGITNFEYNGDKKIIWIHAASIGELKSAEFFINNFSKNYKILITTTTISSAKYADDNFESQILHQFAPFDIDNWIKKFLKNWNPYLIIWIESDLWPNTLSLIKKQKRKAFLINLRISPKSFNRWNKFSSLYSELLDSFIEVFAQSKIDQRRIELLTTKKINFIGNLKFFRNQDLDEKKIIINFSKDVNNVTLMFASTHNNEEKKIIPIIKKLINKYKNLKIIIAPRHPERVKQIMSICSLNNLPAHFESDMILENNSITIINSFGILNKYFEISDIVFLGGSISKLGGHNPIEPALKQCAIITGPNIFNWENIYQEMIEKKACIKINTLSDFIKYLNILIDDTNLRNNLKNNAFKFAKEQFIDTEYLKKIILNQLKKNVKSS